MADVSERFKNAIREALSEAIPEPPPALASDVRVCGRCVPLPKGFRETLKLVGLVKLQATVRQAVLELRPYLLKPKKAPSIQPTSPLADAISEACRQALEERDGLTFITEARLNTRGQAALDPFALKSLGWHSGDQIRVVLKEDHLRLIRVAAGAVEHWRGTVQ